MKKVQLLFSPLLILFLFWGCSDNGTNNNHQHENRPPVINIETPSDGDTLINFPVFISVSASDPDTDDIVVMIYADGEILATLNSKPYEKSWIGTMESGEKIIKACVSDDSLITCDSIKVYVPEREGDFSLRLDANSSKAVFIIWDKLSSADVYRYIVFMNEGTDVDTTDTTIDTLFSLNDTAIFVSSLNPLTTYSFLVIGLPYMGKKPLSNVLTVTTEEVASTHDDHAELIRIPIGSFDRGDTWGEGGAEEYPIMEIFLSEYYIYKYEVTCAQYKEFMGADGYNDPEWWDEEGWTWKYKYNITQPKNWNNPDYNLGDAFPDYPVHGVSWHEASAYARFVGRKLPTEAQWECAARGVVGLDRNIDGVPDGYKFPWGDDFYMDDTVHCNYRSKNEGGTDDYNDGFAFSAPVGSFPSGESPWGLMDMCGNVSEWCNDWFSMGYYNEPGTPINNPQGPDTGYDKSFRGGSYIISSTIALPGYNLRTCKRFSANPETQRHDLGFRLVED